MKKLFVLSFVLSVACVAPAALTINAPATVLEGAPYEITISGLGSDAPLIIGLYDTNAAAYGNPDSWVVTAAAGNLSSVQNNFPSYGGVEVLVDDLMGAGVQDGLWATLNMVAGPSGSSLIFDLWDFRASSAITPSVAVVQFVSDLIHPEPYFYISSQSFSFVGYEAGTNPNNQSVRIANGGQQTLNWSVSDLNLLPDWLTVSPTSGSLVYDQNEVVTLSADITGLTDGQYSYVFEVVDPNALNSPQAITVDLEVIGPILELPSIKDFNFTAYLDGANPSNRNLWISNPGGGTLNWSVDTTGIPSWLTISPISGSLVGPSSIFGDATVLSVDITGLDAGIYSYVFEVADPDAQGSPQTITVGLEVIGPILDISNTDFNFTAYQDGANPSDQILTVSNTGGGTLNWMADITGIPSWLSISPTSGSLAHTVSDDITLSVDIASLTDGNYSYSFEVEDPSAENSPQAITVDLEVIGPILDVSNTEFNFSTDLGGPDPDDQILTISNSGGGTMNWSADTAGIPFWLTISGPAGGSLSYGQSDQLTLSAAVAGLSEGIYAYTFDVAAPDAEGSPDAIQVELNYGNICYTGPDFDEWVAVGRPESWCNPDQSLGDADGSTEIIGKKSRQVGFNDLDILLAGFNKPYSGDPVIDPWIAADFDHAAEIIAKKSRRVGSNDIDVFLTWYNQPLD